MFIWSREQLDFFWINVYSIKIFLNNYSSECNISELVLLNNKKLIFYTDTPWSTEDNNYIEDLSDNKYYIIDKDYYYYLDSLKDYKLFIESNNVKIRLFDFDKYYKKINYIWIKILLLLN